MTHKILSYSVLLLLLLNLHLAVFPTTSGRQLVPNHHLNHPNLHFKDSTPTTPDEVMGSEICGNGDEECLKRRLISEAHLDYIYTQDYHP